MKNNNDDRKKNKALKISLFSLLLASSATTAIVCPIVISNNKTLSLNYIDNTTTYEGNKNRITHFINSNFSKNSYELNGSLKIYGDTGIIGNTGVELTSSERSLVTVDEAFELNLFSFKLKNSLEYYVQKNNINYEMVYVKPYYNDASYATVGIKFYYGIGATYYETIFEYRDISLYGFKKTINQTMIEDYVLEIKKDPKKYFQLKDEVGVIGDAGLYAKNISASSFNLNTNVLKEMKKNNYWLSITSTSMDKFNPNQLKIVFSITYDDGNNISYASGKEVSLGDFDVENGVDDPVSKVKLFISQNKDWINNLNQSFSYTKDDSNQKYSVREAFKKGLIKFNPSYAVNTKLNSDGITLTFNNYQDEVLNPNNELSVLNYEFDSTTPYYRLYFTSYFGTPNEYTESVLIEGLAQDGEFQISEEEKQINALTSYLFDNNLGFESLFDFVPSTNPLSLSDFFMNNNVSFVNGKYNIPFELLFSQYKNYLDNKDKLTNEYEIPFNKFQLKLKDSSLSLPTNINYNGETFNLQVIAKKILDCFNATSHTNIMQQLYSLTSSTDESSKPSINLNMFLGNANEGTLFISVELLTLYVNDYFISMQSYLNEILTNITNILNPQNVEFEMLVQNKEQLKQLIYKRQWNSIFTSANIYNLNLNNAFLNLLPSLKIDIDLSYFQKLTLEEIQTINQTEKIEIQILISMNNLTKNYVLIKSFDELIRQ